MARRSDISISLYNLSLILFKYIPIISGLALMLDCGLLLCSQHPYFAALVFGTSLTDMLALMAASFTFRFCWLHRAFILYCFAFSFAIDYQVVYGFGSYLTHARVLIFILGLFLMLLLFKRGIKIS